MEKSPSKNLKKPGVKKEIKNSFTTKQPGQINVAGEVFFLDLPGDSQTSITSRLFDDSIKGDIAFQLLFLGGDPKENRGPLFSKDEQTLLRRVFRTVFGIGKTSKKGIAVPCEKKERDLMMKAILHRRAVLIQTIMAYDELASDDIHARYLRDHLSRLTKLIDIDIPGSKADCSLTGIVDPNAPEPLALNDDRMLRLVEIFAFLLAQGKNPVSELVDRLPIPREILTRMAVADAPDIYEYEEDYKKEHNGSTPAYGPTLLKLRRVLMDDAELAQSLSGNEELTQSFQEIEKAINISEDMINGKTFAERRDLILKKLGSLDSDIASKIREASNTNKKLATVKEELNKITAERDDCRSKLAALEAAKKTQDTELADLKTKFADSEFKLKNCLAEKEALQKRLTEATERLASYRELETKLNAALETIQKLQSEKTVTPEDSAILQEQLNQVNEQLRVLTENSERALSEKEEQINALEEAARKGQATLEANQKALEESQVNFNKNVQEIETLKENLELLRGTLNSLGEESKKTIEEKDSTILELKETHAEDLEAKETAIAELQRKISKAESAKNEIQAKLEPLTQANTDLTSQLLLLKAKLQQNENELQTTKDQLALFQKSITQPSSGAASSSASLRLPSKVL